MRLVLRNQAGADLDTTHYYTDWDAVRRFADDAADAVEAAHD